MGISTAYSNSGGLKSLQFVTGAVPINNTTTTISIPVAVDSSNTILFASYANAGTGGDVLWSKIDFTNSTTLTLTRNTADAATPSATVNIFVAEFFPGLIKSIQRVAITMSSTNGTATITSVDTTKTILVDSGFLGTSSVQNGIPIRYTLNSATQVAAKNNQDGTANVQVVEFY